MPENSGKCRLKIKRRIRVGSFLASTRRDLIWVSCDRTDHDHGEPSMRYPYPRPDDLLVEPEVLYAEMTGGSDATR